jgi:hypothetical protein
MLGTVYFVFFSILGYLLLKGSVADPDPYVFWASWIRIQILLSSVRKTLIPTVLLLLLTFYLYM